MRGEGGSWCQVRVLTLVTSEGGRWSAEGKGRRGMVGWGQNLGDVSPYQRNVGSIHPEPTAGTPCGPLQLGPTMAHWRSAQGALRCLAGGDPEVQVVSPPVTTWRGCGRVASVLLVQGLVYADVRLLLLSGGQQEGLLMQGSLLTTRQGAACPAQL